jgi:pSer/pThr/pTyr-binding forkhead associated (FHA) protein
MTEPASQDPADSAATIGSNWSNGPFLVYTNDSGDRQFVLLESSSSVTIGRGAGCDLRLTWDEEVSRIHAQLDRMGTDWTLVDDGLSRNGTFLNGRRIDGRRLLHDGDTFVIGGTSFLYQSAQGSGVQATRVARDTVTVLSLSPTQRQILTALCRPYKDGAPYATPGSNQQISAELYLSVDAVKTHLRVLFQKFHIEDLPQNQKRAKLVERAFSLGLINRRDL